MIDIQLSEEKVLRGQTFTGSIYITSFSSYTADKVEASILMKEKYIDKYGQAREFHSIKKEILERNHVEVTPSGIYISFEYTISEDAPYTFFQYPVGITWGIHVSIRKSRFFSEKKWHELIVLPHLLKFEPSPLDRVPLLLKREIFPGITGYYLQLWRSLWRSTAISIHTDEDYYSPGDTVSGNVQVFKQINNADLRIYFVFLRGNIFLGKKKERKFKAIVEKEQLILHTNETFQSGSVVPFSFPLPLFTYPDFETEHSGVHWKVRAVVSRFIMMKVAECQLKVRPLIF